MLFLPPWRRFVQLFVHLFVQATGIARHVDLGLWEPANSLVEDKGWSYSLRALIPSSLEQSQASVFLRNVSFL